MEENTRTREDRSRDPWEEEIDLRELILGVLKKWYLWVGLPLVVMIAVAGYLLLAEQPYQLSTIFTFDEGQTGVEQLGLSFPGETTIRHRLFSLSRLAPIYEEHFLQEEDDLISSTLSFRRSVDFEKINDHYQLSYETTRPDSAAELLNAMVADFTDSERERQLETIERRHDIYQRELEHIQAKWQAWQEETGRLVGDFDDISPPDPDEPNGGELVWRLTETTGPIPEELQVLQHNQQYISRIESIEENIFWAQTLMEEPGELIEHFPAESPGDPVDLNRRRNTLLTGAVTFLLALFGTAFWEIL